MMGDRRTGLTITALGRAAWPPLRPFLCGVVLAVLLSLAGSNASAQKRSMVVERFDATIQVEENGWIDVREEIQVRFTGSWNGIFRNIPVEYRTPQGFSYKLWLDAVSVTGLDAEPLEYWNKRERHYRQLKIRVPGASDAVRTVVIRYRVPNGLKYWDEYEELYWNVTGDEWDVPIQAATATILLPEGLDGLRTASWTGGYGSTENGASVSEIEGGFYFESSRGLNFREGMTVAIAWNPGVLSQPTAFRVVGSFLRANWLLFLPLFSLGLMWRVWYTRGRDPRRLPIAPQYSPPDDLTPAQAGTLIDNRPDMRDITASLVDLAVRGYLRIEEVENYGLKKWFKSTDYLIVSLKDTEARSGLHRHEQELLRGVFAGGRGTCPALITRGGVLHTPAFHQIGTFRRTHGAGLLQQAPRQGLPRIFGSRGGGLGCGHSRRHSAFGLPPNVRSLRDRGGGGECPADHDFRVLDARPNGQRGQSIRARTRI